MTTISLTYNERNELAKKTIDFLLSLGVFKVETYFHRLSIDFASALQRRIIGGKSKQSFEIKELFMN